MRRRIRRILHKQMVPLGRKRFPQISLIDVMNKERYEANLLPVQGPKMSR